MHREDLLVYDGRNRQAIEAVRERLPQLDVISALALVVEAVYTVDARAFVIAAEDEEIFGVFDFIRQEQADCFERLLASIHIVAEEEVVCFGREATVLEQTEQVVVLPVYITAYLKTGLASVSAFYSGPLVLHQFIATHLYGRLKLEQYGLRDENLSCFRAEIANLRLEQLDLLSRPAAAHFQQSVYDGVEVHLILVCHCHRLLSASSA